MIKAIPPHQPDDSPYFVWAVFNNITRQCIGLSLSDSITSGKTLVLKIVSDEPLSLHTLTWHGTYDDGYPVDKAKDPSYKPAVYESALENKMYDRLFRAYPPPAILVAILDQFQILFGRPDGITPALVTPLMAEILQLHRASSKKFGKDVRMFTTSDQHQFVSKEDERKQFATAFTTAPVVSAGGGDK